MRTRSSCSARRPTILLTGANGQIGHELAHALRELGTVATPSHTEMDLCNLHQVRAVIHATAPDLIVNAAAYTDVENAEGHEETAMRVNAEAPAAMAEAMRHSGGAIIHFSTDYVFDGRKPGPYDENDPVNPLNVYGRSKAAGESAIRDSDIPHLILRTSWVYGLRRDNFLMKMRRAAADRKEIRVVDDQFGSPTWSRTVADACASAVSGWTSESNVARAAEDAWWASRSGTYHVCGQGLTNWFNFANTIFELFPEKPALLTAVGSFDYRARARRPVNSTLGCEKFNKTFYALPCWQDALRDCRLQAPQIFQKESLPTSYTTKKAHSSC